MITVSLPFSDIELSDGTDCVVFSQCDMPNGAFPLMEELRRQGHLIDVTILVGKTQRSIDAHKLVLASTVSTVNTYALSFYVTKTVLVGPKWFFSDQIDLDLTIMIWSRPK